MLSAVQKVSNFWLKDDSTEEDLQMGLTDSERRFAVAALRAKYYRADRGEVWWWFDDSIYTFARLLRDQSYVVIDGFFATPNTSAETSCSRSTDLSGEVKTKWQAGLLSENGQVVDRTDGTNTSHAKVEVRGDYIGWFDGFVDEGWSQIDNNASLPGYIRKVSTLVKEMARFLPEELSGIQSRSRAMVTCYPPGSRYTKHVDNGGKQSNGRRLTTLLYLNDGWQVGDGGELAVYTPGGQVLQETIAPVGDRLVMFWSDHRVPHEVLETHKERFTVTIWFFDEEEWQAAKRSGIIQKPTHLQSSSGAKSNDCKVLDAGCQMSTQVPGDSKFNFVHEDAPPECREPDGSDLRPVRGDRGDRDVEDTTQLVQGQLAILTDRLDTPSGRQPSVQVGLDPTLGPHLEHELKSMPATGPGFTVITNDTTAHDLKVVVALPALQPPLVMADITVDISPSLLVVSANHPQLLQGRCSGGPNSNCAQIDLQHEVDTDRVEVKFSKRKMTISVTMAILLREA